MNQFSMRRTWGPQAKYPLVIDYKPVNNDFYIIAGPCSVESEHQIDAVAKFVSINGATHLRGGVFRAGTFGSKNFGWVDLKLIKAYRESAKAYGLKNIIEVLDYRDLRWVQEYCDVLQVGARQMQNYTLLREVGKSGKSVFLKRHPGATLDEWLGAANQVLEAGCKDLRLIERGTSTLHTDARWTFTPHTIPSVASISALQVISDASHSTGRRDLVPSMALAGVAAGASGILVEVHPEPDKSLSDADQALSFNDFSKLIEKVKKVREAIK
jgi:3-deoxy-7-phosphoheptulonate synthase